MMECLTPALKSARTAFSLPFLSNLAPECAGAGIRLTDAAASLRARQLILSLLLSE
jgi:hypothetical protein